MRIRNKAKRVCKRYAPEDREMKRKENEHRKSWRARKRNRYQEKQPDIEREEEKLMREGNVGREERETNIDR